MFSMHFLNIYSKNLNKWWIGTVYNSQKINVIKQISYEKYKCKNIYNILYAAIYDNGFYLIEYNYKDKTPNPNKPHRITSGIKYWENDIGRKFENYKLFALRFGGKTFDHFIRILDINEAEYFSNKHYKIIGDISRYWSSEKHCVIQRENYPLNYLSKKPHIEVDNSKLIWHIYDKKIMCIKGFILMKNTFLHF